MSYSINAGISVSPDNGTTWYALSDHNRQPIQYAPQRIEQVQRMANGTMRKFVVANKAIYDTTWQALPSASQTITSQSGISLQSYQPTVDGKMGAAFMKAFYDKYVTQPILLKLTYAVDNITGTGHVPSQLANPSTDNHQILTVYMTNFVYTVSKRLTLLDYVDVTLQFTEV
jgi:hypothetical protein